ncbi:MAG: hypothetical protein V8T29_08490 [Oscillospiraceae bacterium]
MVGRWNRVAGCGLLDAPALEPTRAVRSLRMGIGRVRICRNAVQDWDRRLLVRPGGCT